MSIMHPDVFGVSLTTILRCATEALLELPRSVSTDALGGIRNLKYNELG
jgi:hypothetical protein